MHTAVVIIVYNCTPYRFHTQLAIIKATTVGIACGDWIICLLFDS